MTPYGLGFAGAGWLGECLLKELPRFPELRLAAVQDANAELAEQVGRRYGSPWWGADYGEPPYVRVYELLDAAYAAVSGTGSKAAAGSAPASR
jgi:predicted dehydrogenase